MIPTLIFALTTPNDVSNYSSMVLFVSYILLYFLLFFYKHGLIYIHAHSFLCSTNFFGGMFGHFFTIHMNITMYFFFLVLHC